MSRYTKVFDQAKNEGRGILVPFLMIGDPDVEQCLDWADMLVEQGADALELGMPFSDPVADGPVIQASAIRALNAGTTPDICFEVIAKIRQRYPDLPMGLLSYANLAVARGIEQFYSDARKSGLDSILLADIPAHANAAFAQAANKHNICNILIAPPNASDDLLRIIAKKSEGYTYVVSRSGVTGANDEAGFPTKIILNLNEFGAPPSLLGFGISSGRDVRQAIGSGCAGAICGSALVKIVAESSSENRLKQGRKLMAELCTGLTN